MRDALLTIVVAGSLFSPVGAEPPEHEAKASLNDINHSFIEAHAAARKFNLATGGPLILLENGQLTLIRGGKEEAAEVTIGDYNTVKVFTHIPVAIYLMLTDHVDGELDASQLDVLREYRGKLDRLRKTLEKLDLDRVSLARQRRIVSASSEFLGGVVDEKRCSETDLLVFTQSMTPLMKANIAVAARSQLDAMHTQVMAWKKQMSPKEWATLRVAVKGAVLARDGNLSLQYFERLLELRGEGNRLVYMESYYPPIPLQTLVATRAVDAGIGKAFFNDPERMFRDVLSDAAATYIKEMKFD